MVEGRRLSGVECVERHTCGVWSGSMGAGGKRAPACKSEATRSYTQGLAVRGSVPPHVHTDERHHGGSNAPAHKSVCTPIAVQNLQGGVDIERGSRANRASVPKVEKSRGKRRCGVREICALSRASPCINPSRKRLRTKVVLGFPARHRGDLSSISKSGGVVENSDLP